MLMLSDFYIIDFTRLSPWMNGTKKATSKYADGFF
jgi:hypothetical protein